MESHQLALRLISFPSASIFLTRPMAVADPFPSDEHSKVKTAGVQSSFSLASLPMRRREQPLVAIPNKNCLYARLSNDEINSAREHNDVSSLMTK